MIESVNGSQILKRHMQMFILQNAELILILAPRIFSALQEPVVQKGRVID